MKNTFLLTLFFIPALSFAQALEGEFVRTPFWEAPIKRNHQVEATVENSERLEKVCSSYAKSVKLASQTDDIAFLKRHIESLRKRPHLDNWEINKFEDTFIVKLEDLELNVQASSEDYSISSLPHFKQSSSVQDIFLNDMTSFEFISEEDSLTALSKKVGLDLTSPEVSYVSGKGIQLKVDSKDIACDLLNKKLILSATVKSQVRPEKSEIKKLEKFYQFDFMAEFSKVLKLNVNDRKKAFLLGLRLGNILIQNSTTNERALIEKDFLKLMSFLLKDESISIGRNVYEDSSRFWLDMSLYQQDVDLHLTIR